MRIGFLACPETLPGAGIRRGDAFEHDLQVGALRPAFAARGLDLIEIEWRSAIADFADMHMVLLGTAWDYQDHAEAFLQKLDALQAAGIQVCNPPELIRWNISKLYLRELEHAGLKIIPTVWIDRPGAQDAVSAFAHFGCDKIVVKQQTGAGGFGQHLFSKSSPPADSWKMSCKAMIQPYLPAIETEGELSFIFIDGKLSHALCKTPTAGDYRIQSLYGGRETPIQPSAGDIAAARAVIDALPGETPLYARIDMLRADDGAMMVMEAEVIEPFLYPVQGPELGDRLAEAIVARLDRSARKET